MHIRIDALILRAVAARASRARRRASPVLAGAAMLLGFAIYAGVRPGAERGLVQT
ncbi:MAG: hypothetical protein MZV65_49030 [Chromatiales bacterium]|nr:hypothetical protein [Chromatiales bacterium]